MVPAEELPVVVEEEAEEETRESATVGEERWEAVAEEQPSSVEAGAPYLQVAAAEVAAAEVAAERSP